MDRKEFQKLAVRTESIVEDPKLTSEDYDIFISALKAFNDVTEILDAYKKHIFYRDSSGNRKELDYNKIRANAANAREFLYDVNLFIAESNLAKSTAPPVADVPLLDDARVLHALLGTITEHGEIADALLTAFSSGELDVVNVCEELGDSDWYKALFYEATDIDWETVQKMIIKKLEIRYADKIFSVEEAKNRDLEKERDLLEAALIGYVEKYVERQ